MKNVTLVAAMLLANPGMRSYTGALEEADAILRVCGEDPDAQFTIALADPCGVTAGDEVTE